jgi:hypothetical protein
MSQQLAKFTDEEKAKGYKLDEARRRARLRVDMLAQQGQHETAQREMARARGERGPAWWIMRIAFLVMLKGAIIWKLIQWMAARP